MGSLLINDRLLTLHHGGSFRKLFGTHTWKNLIEPWEYESELSLGVRESFTSRSYGAAAVLVSFNFVGTTLPLWGASRVIHSQLIMDSHGTRPSSAPDGVTGHLVTTAAAWESSRRRCTSLLS